MFIPEVLKERRGDLDGLRGVAIALTIFLHYVSRSGYFSYDVPEPIEALLDSFWSGVDIFFVLSGFLIGGIIIDNRRSSNFFRVFYLRRALRILPVALLTIAVAYVAFPYLGVMRPTNRQVPPFAYILFINNFWTANGVAAYPPLGPMWSLAIEEQFYLFAPTLILLSSPRKLMFALILIVLASPFLRNANLGYSMWDFTFYRLDGFSAGVLAALLIRDQEFNAYALAHRWKIGLFTLSFVMAALLLSMVPHMPSHRVVYGISLNSIATAGIIVSLTFSRSSWLSKALSWQPLAALGRRSYFLYLLHMPVLLSMKASNVPRLLQPSAALLICLVGAWASWRYLESPLINFGKRKNYVGRL